MMHDQRNSKVALLLVIWRVNDNGVAFGAWLFNFGEIDECLCRGSASRLARILNVRYQTD